jgi:hypothetical protein
MAFAGMFALGVFVGGIVTLGLKFTSSYDAFIKVMGAVLAATLSGVAVGFMDKYKGSAQPESFFMYPIGLLIALLWLYFPDVENQTNPLVKWGGMVSIVIVTIIASFLALGPACREWLRFTF